MIKRIVVGYDGSEHSLRAIDFLKKLDSAKEADISVVMVIDFENQYSINIPKQVYDDIRAKSEQSLREVVDRLKSEGYRATDILLVGSPAEQILEYANKFRADLIIVGSRGLSRFRGMLLGSVSAGLVHESLIPVLVVKK